MQSGDGDRPVGYTGGNTNEAVMAVGAPSKRGDPRWQHRATTTASWTLDAPGPKIRPPSLKDRTGFRTVRYVRAVSLTAAVFLQSGNGPSRGESESGFGATMIRRRFAARRR